MQLADGWCWPKLYATIMNNKIKNDLNIIWQMNLFIKFVMNNPHSSVCIRFICCCCCFFLCKFLHNVVQRHSVRLKQRWEWSNIAFFVCFFFLFSASNMISNAWIKKGETWKNSYESMNHEIDVISTAKKKSTMQQQHFNSCKHCCMNVLLRENFDVSFWHE